MGVDRPDVHLALAEDAEPYLSVMFSERMSHNAMRLVNKKRLKGVDLALRYRIDKLPGAGGSIYHQDSAEHGSDRVGELQFLLALEEVTPEMGGHAIRQPFIS